MDLASALFSLMRRTLMTWAIQYGSSATTHKASVSSVANIIVEHSTDLDEVAPARIRMDLFRSRPIAKRTFWEQKFCHCHGRLGYSTGTGMIFLGLNCLKAADARHNSRALAGKPIKNA